MTMCRRTPWSGATRREQSGIGRGAIPLAGNPNSVAVRDGIDELGAVADDAAVQRDAVGADASVDPAVPGHGQLAADQDEAGEAEVAGQGEVAFDRVEERSNQVAGNLRQSVSSSFSLVSVTRSVSWKATSGLAERLARLERACDWNAGCF